MNYWRDDGGRGRNVGFRGKKFKFVMNFFF